MTSDAAMFNAFDCWQSLNKSHLQTLRESQSWLEVLLVCSTQNVTLLFVSKVSKIVIKILESGWS